MILEGVRLLQEGKLDQAEYLLLEGGQFHPYRKQSRPPGCRLLALTLLIETVSKAAWSNSMVCKLKM